MKMGAGQAYFDEDLKGQVKHRTHERKAVLVKASETGWSSMRVSSFRLDGACWLQFQRATLGVNGILCCKL